MAGSPVSKIPRHWIPLVTNTANISCINFSIMQDDLQCKRQTMLYTIALVQLQMFQLLINILQRSCQPLQTSLRYMYLSCSNLPSLKKPVYSRFCRSKHKSRNMANMIPHVGELKWLSKTLPTARCRCKRQLPSHSEHWGMLLRNRAEQQELGNTSGIFSFCQLEPARFLEVQQYFSVSNWERSHRFFQLISGLRQH